MYKRVCEVLGIDVTKLCINGEYSPRKACTDSEARSKLLSLFRVLYYMFALQPVGLSVWLVIAAGIIALIAIVFFI